MGDTKKRLDNFTCTPVDEKAHILNQLECCQIYFKHVEKNTSLTGNTSEFYCNLRVLIGILQKLPSELESRTKEIIRDISISLIYTIASCSLPLDSQMLCSTAYCSALHAVLDTYETRILFEAYLSTDENENILLHFGRSSQDICINNVEVFKICLCHGILQSNEVSSILYSSEERVDGSPLIFIMLTLLEEACMKYSRLTSIAFKVLVSWMRKVCLELKLNMTSDILRRIFFIINSNWESPINGVKEQNAKVFEHFLDVCSANKRYWHDHETTFQSVTTLLHHTMEDQPWTMKSKYFMLSMLLPRYGVKKAFAAFPDLAPGLVSSLSYSHLVSAGSDVYKSCLNNLDVDDWIDIFMVPILDILTGRDVVSIEKQNAFNYWIPSTLKKFPLLLNVLLDQLIDVSQPSGFENAMFSITSLLKLGQKGGLLFNTWDDSFTVSSLAFLEFLNLMNSAIQHSNEAIRAEAFAVVCISSKTCIIPSPKEFELVQIFLLENVNIDSASLRQAILNSFTVFLIRLHDSSLHELKVRESTQISKKCGKNKKDTLANEEMDLTVMSQNIQFLNWLHHFLISSIEPGTNYQRKILSLQLYKLVLSYFTEPTERTKKSSGLRRKGMALKAEKVMKYALKLGKWPFNSERSRKTILNCVLDSTDDIRETAGLILMEYFGFKEPNTEENKPLLDYAVKLCTSPMFYETESGALLMKVLGNWTYRMPPKKSDELICSMVGVQFNKTSLNRNKSHGSILMLSNQNKLLDGLQNKSNRSSPNTVESSKDAEVEIKKKVGTWEGLLFMAPSYLKEVCAVELSDDKIIFEDNLAVVARDGTVGQATTTSFASKPHYSSSTQTDLVEDSSNNTVSGHVRNPLFSDMKEKGENESSESYKSFKNGVETSAEFLASQRYQSPPPDSCRDSGDYFLLVDQGEVQHKSVPEETSPLPCVFERQVQQDSWGRQATEEEADYQSDIQTFWRPRRQKYSRKRKKLKNIGKSEQAEVTESSRSCRYDGYILTASTKDETKEKIPFVNRSRDYRDLSVCNSDNTPDCQYVPISVVNEAKANSYQNTSSTAGYESHKFRQPDYVALSITLDTDFPSLAAGSQGRKQVDGNGFGQKSKEFPQHRSQPHHTSKGFYSSTQQNVEAFLPSGDQMSFPSEDWDLNEPSDRETIHRSLSKFGTSRHPSKNNSGNLGSENLFQTYNGSAPLSVFLLTQAEAQLALLKEDLFQAASSGSPLHGTITALTRLATQSDGPECGSMSAEEVDRTVALLEQTVSFFLDLLAAKSGSATGVPPSFAEMDEAIQSSILYSVSDLVPLEEEGMQLSPAHQLVLNCVWLNLKACCNLASGLTCSADCSVAAVKCCGSLITQVLTRCRHKGAIESAGVALSVYVKTITSQTGEYNSTTDKDLQLMLGQLLTEFLNSLVCGGSKASVTRRSAGLSILIHRIVASDMQAGKPLLHMCVSQLLDIARTPFSSMASSEQRSVLVDLPQAQALHFLRILVQDSSLRQDMAQYMSSVTIICFGNFSSPLWTIRNAALQLSGALIPKLVGQKKIHDEELTLGSGISVEEFFNHFPELTNFMLVSLQNAANCHPSEALQQHADLIPMLSLLAKVTVGIEIFISSSLVEKITQYRVYFLQLTSSPIYHVRKLAAKAYERFIPFSSTYKAIVTIVDKLHMHSTDCVGTQLNCLDFKENKLNGILLTIKYLLEKLKQDSENISKLKSKIPEIITILKEAVSNCIIWDSCTYFNRVLLLDLVEDEVNAVEPAYFSSDETFTKIQNVHKTLEKEKHQNSFKPGLFLWAAKVIDVVVKKCCPNHLVSTWYNSYMLFNHCPDIVRSAFASLKWRLQCGENIDGAVRDSLFIALLKVCLDLNEERHSLFSLLDIMLVLIQDMKVNVVITFKELQKISLWSNTENKSEHSTIALPVVAGLLSQYFAHGHCIELSTQTLEFLRKFSLCVKDRSDVMKYEEDFRLNAARAIHLLAPLLREMLAERFEEFSTKEMLKDIIEIILDVELTLLQDEDHDVRKEAAKFVPAYTSCTNNMLMNPYSSLRKLMEPDVLLTFLTVSQAMEFLWKKLHYTHELENIAMKYSHHSNKNGTITSPFDHGTNNIYSEETKMIDVFGKSLQEILQIANKKERNGLRKLIKYRLVNFKDDVGTVLSLLKETVSCGISSASSDNETCYIIAKKLMYQSDVMAALSFMKNCDIESVMLELRQILKFCTN